MFKPHLPRLVLLLALHALLVSHVCAATRHWDGGGTTGFWDTAANWSNNVAPINGDALFFPTNVVRLINTNRASANLTNFHSIRFTGDGYNVFSVPPINLTNGLTNVVASGSANTLNASLTLRGNQTWAVSGRSMLTVNSNVNWAGFSFTNDIDGTLVGNGNWNGTGGAQLNKLGSGILELNGVSSSIPTVRVADGILRVDGALTAATSFVISNGASLTGTGSVSAFSCAGDFSPGSISAPGLLTMTGAGNAAFTTGARFFANLDGLTPGFSHDQFRTPTSPNLSGATLLIQRSFSFPFVLGQKFVIITNTGAAAQSTAFANLAQNARVTNNGVVFQISYTGGTGNDVELTVVSVAVTPTGNTAVWDGDAQPNRDWTNALNWAGNALPAQGDNLVFPASVPVVRRVLRNSFTNTPTFNRLTFGDLTGESWSLSGEAFKLLGGIVSTSPAPSVGSVFLGAPQIDLTAAQTFAATNLNLRVSTDLTLGGNTLTLAPETGSQITLVGNFIGSGVLVKNGGGTLVISANATSAVPVTMNSGVTRVPAGRFTGSGNWLLNGGRLELSGGVVPRIPANSGTLVAALSADARSTNAVLGDMVLNAATTFEAVLSEPTDKFGNPHALLHVGGGATLNNAALSVLAPDLAFVGTTFLVIGQPGAAPFVGIFAGKPEGAVFEALNSAGFLLPMRISYVGGDGNDLTLTILAPTPSGLTREWNGLGADEFWSTAANWADDLVPTSGDAVRFPFTAARRTNENDQPVFLDTLTWLGSNYTQHGATALLGGLRAGHAGGTNEMLGSLVTLAAQTWAVSNAAAVLRISGESGIGPAAAGAGLEESGGILALGNVTKTGAGTLHLPGVSVQMAGSLIINGGAVLLHQGAISGGLNETNGGIHLLQGVFEATEGRARALNVAGGEVVARLALDSGVPARSGFSANTIAFDAGTTLTMVGTNRSLPGAALNCVDLGIDGVRFNAQLPPGLPRNLLITVANYVGPLDGIFAGLPEGSVTNFNGNFVRVRYADTIQDGEGLYITLTVLAGPPPRFTGFTRVNATTLILQGRGPAGELIALEGTTDFVTWTPLGSTVAGPDEFGFVVNPTTPAFRFFRLLVP